MNPELQEKLKAAKTAEELVDLAREEGVELSDEQLDSIACVIDLLLKYSRTRKPGFPL